MRGCSYKRIDYGGCEAWVRGVLGNLGGLCVMCLIHFEGLFEIIYYIFDKGVLGREILKSIFLWTHEMQEYTLFDCDSKMIMYVGKFVQA